MATALADDSRFPDLPRPMQERSLRREGMPLDPKDWTMMDWLEDLTAADSVQDKLFAMEVVRKMARAGERFLAGDLAAYAEGLPELVDMDI